MEFDAATLLQYACERFEMKQYDDALDAFILTYNMGYEQEWILQNIYECYMQGNSEEFQKAYQKQGMFKKIPFEDCLLDFIPYRDGEYYIYDKERQMFLGIFSVSEIENAEIDPVLNELEFSAVATEVDWSLKNLISILAEKSHRKIYIVCHDIRRCMSYWKIPEMVENLERVCVFEGREEMQQYFHKNTAEYLPKIPYGTEEIRDAIEKIIMQEHQYRLTPVGRNTDNVLLTIGIPTHDRGNLLLKRLKNLRKMSYDAEIEFAISKNGNNYYQKEYQEVENISDSRIKYVGYDKELTLTENWQNVIKIACGKYVLMVSDEDDVVISALEHYLKLFNENNELAVIRSKTVFQYAEINAKQYFRCGESAFLEGFLCNNYLSGIIYNRKMFLNANIEYWDCKFGNNYFYYIYPHHWWQVVLSFIGDYAVDTVILIEEGQSALIEEAQKYKEDGVETFATLVDSGENISEVSTYKSRIKQFVAATELINDFDKFDDELKAKALFLLVNKTMYLMHLVLKYYNYKKNEFANEMQNLIEEVELATQRLKIDISWKKRIFKEIWSFINMVEIE